MERMSIRFSRLKSLRFDCRICSAAIEIPLRELTTEVGVQRVLNLCQDTPVERTAENKVHWEKVSKFCKLLVEIQSSTPENQELGMPLDIQIVSTSDDL